MIIQHISSLENPELEPYLTLRENTRHWKKGFFVAEGEKVVRQLIHSDIPVVSFLMTKIWFDALENELHHVRFQRTLVFIGSDALLDSIVGFSLHKKLIAIARIPENSSLGHLVSQSSDLNRIVGLEGIADAENMGAIMRNCAAFGIRSLLTSHDSSNPYLRRSVRVSMGALFSLTIHRSDDLSNSLFQLKSEYGFQIIGATPQGGVDNLDEFSSKSVCLLFGSEAQGLTKEILSICDGLYSIPMAAQMDSLNVANAVAVTLYEALRRRQ
jgi:tRNA G18 (ribose-2'-O)-methylase SpoU